MYVCSFSEHVCDQLIMPDQNFIPMGFIVEEESIIQVIIVGAIMFLRNNGCYIYTIYIFITGTWPR